MKTITNIEQSNNFFKAFESSKDLRNVEFKFENRISLNSFLNDSIESILSLKDSKEIFESDVLDEVLDLEYHIDKKI